MRLAPICAALLGGVALSASAAVTPLDWPEEAEGRHATAFHCAAVMTAFGLAYATATEMTGAPEGLPPGTLPRALLAEAGGAARLGEIRTQAEAWADHSESMASTHFFPRLSGEGTPYLADEGRMLMLAVQECVARFGL
ncbi:hypothetical protein HKCCSP123_18475 [Rhodobacterales bacterium HKCCSP123]|nr:hypothetical protein [Rhodobacterales bacterium HKCCSP123]